MSSAVPNQDRGADEVERPLQTRSPKIGIQSAVILLYCMLCTISTNIYK